MATKLNYRKIYEQYYGSIPIDSDGRTYDIHHIDGDRNNNDPSNLKAITIQDHCNIHYEQGDYAAAHALAMKMQKPHEEISSLAKLAAQKRTVAGKNPFSGPVLNQKKMENGTHPFLKENLPEFSCPYCKKVVRGYGVINHINNCKLKKLAGIMSWV